MKVKDVMTVDVKSCRLETNAAEAVKMMWDQDCGALPIVNDDRKVVGMITDRDLSVAVATRGRAAERIAVNDVATGKAYTCQAEDDVPAALEVMKAQQVHRLPVVDAQGRLEGILSMNDIVLHSGAASPNQIMDSLAGICAPRRKAAVAGAAHSVAERVVAKEPDGTFEFIECPACGSRDTCATPRGDGVEELECNACGVIVGPAIVP